MHANFTAWCFAKKAAAFFRMSRSSGGCGSPCAAAQAPRARPSSGRCGRASGRLGHAGPTDPRRRRSGRAPGRRFNALALVEDQPDGLGLELTEKRRRVRRGGDRDPCGTSYPPFGRCPRDRVKPTHPFGKLRSLLCASAPDGLFRRVPAQLTAVRSDSATWVAARRLAT